MELIGLVVVEELTTEKVGAAVGSEEHAAGRLALQNPGVQRNDCGAVLDVREAVRQEQRAVDPQATKEKERIGRQRHRQGELWTRLERRRTGAEASEKG